jgi:hypothetical protein
LNIFLILLTAIFGFSTGLGLSGSITAAVITGLLAGGVAASILWKSPIIQIEKSAYTKELQILSMIGIIGLTQTEQSTNTVEDYSPNVGRLIVSENG